MNETTELVVVRTFSTAPEAHVARSVLDAAGIPTQLADDGIVAANWLYSNAVGGVKLLVPSGRTAEAMAVLDTPAQESEQAFLEDRSQPEGDSTWEACPQCGGTEFKPIKRGRRWAALTWLLLGVPLVPVQRALICRQCGTAWEARERNPT